MGGVGSVGRDQEDGVSRMGSVGWDLWDGICGVDPWDGIPGAGSVGWNQWV